MLAAGGYALSTGISIPGPVERAPDAVAGMLRAVVRCRPAAALGIAGLLNLVVTITGVMLLPLSEEGWGRGEGASGWRPHAWASARSALRHWRGWLYPSQRPPRPGGWSRSASRSRWSRPLRCRGPRCHCSPWPAPPHGGQSLLTGTLQDAVPDRYRAGALGLADTIMVGACLVGSLVAPALSRYAGARPALLLVAAAAVLPVLAVRLLRTRELATPYDAASERARTESQSGPDPRGGTPTARAAAGPDPRGPPPVGAARVG